jgi:hypothetical protein
MLATIITNVVTALVSALGGWLLHYFQTAAKDKAAQTAADAATQKAVDDDKAAVTPEERDNAAKGISDNV